MIQPIIDAVQSLPLVVRQWLYALIALAALVVTALQAAHGDWKEAAFGLIVTIGGTVARINTKAPPGDGLVLSQYPLIALQNEVAAREAVIGQPPFGTQFTDDGIVADSQQPPGGTK